MLRSLLFLALAFPAHALEFVKQVRAPDAIVALVNDPAPKILVAWLDETGHPNALQFLEIGPDVALGGQVADVATTVTGLASGLEELNPFGAVAIPAKIALLHSTADMPVVECVAVRQMLASAGWGAGAWNTLILMGVPPPLAAGAAVLAAVHAYDAEQALLSCALQRLGE